METVILNKAFEITFDWLSRDHGDTVERATYAAMGIHIQTHVATEVEDLLAKTVRGTVRASAHRAALWLAANWWRLRWEPEAGTPSWKMSHHIGAAGGGYAWPDLSFISDGSAVLVHCRPTSAGTADPIRFLSSFDEVIPAKAFERGVDEFIDAVIERLSSQAGGYRQLKEIWDEVREERREPESTEWRKLEAMMGFDPDEGPEKLIDSLRTQKASVGSSAVEEVAAAASSGAIDMLEFLRCEAQSRAIPAEIPDYASLRNELQPLFNTGRPPWRQAAQAARTVREKWQLKPGPISSETLENLFGIGHEVFRVSMTDRFSSISAGYRQNEDGAIRVFLNKKHPTSVRFALSRLVADHLYAERQDRLLPATDAKTARQKFQRGFAQEFLCPFEDLRAYLGGKTPTDEIIEEAAVHFDVSPLLAKTLLVNRGVLSRDVLDM